MPPQILIVEDEWLIAEDYAATLRAAGHEIVGPCPSVKTAIKAIDAQHVDCALLDIDLGNEKSYPIAEHLQNLNIPCQFLSGHNIRELPEPFTGHLVLAKPLERSALVAAVEGMCPSS